MDKMGKEIYSSVGPCFQTSNNFVKKNLINLLIQIDPCFCVLQKREFWVIFFSGLKDRQPSKKKEKKKKADMADTRKPLKLSKPTPEGRGRRSCTVSTTKPTNLSQFSHKKVGGGMGGGNM